MFSGTSLYPVDVSYGGKCIAGTPFIVPKPGPHTPHCYFIYPGYFFHSFIIMMIREVTHKYNSANGVLRRNVLELTLYATFHDEN